MNPESFLCAMVANHHLVDQGLHQFPGEGNRNRCDETDPVRRQARGQQGNREQPTAGQLGHFGVEGHHLGVGDHVRSADLVDATDGRTFGLTGGHEVLDHVGDGDGLALVVDPPGRHHDGQDLDQ